jgi:NTE family protein
MVAGWLPGGVVSTQPIKDTVRRAVPGSGWVEHPAFWAVATDYKTGRRTCFGREGAPEAELADAVAASCAIPGFYRPVEIGDRRYVDGGVCSSSNVDLLAGEGLDLLICLNPTSSRDTKAGAQPFRQMAHRARLASGRRLGYEAKKVRANGTDVVIVQPTAADLEVMGSNLMSTSRRHEVIETAIETVREQLRTPDTAEKLAGLPAGEPHKIRRPDGPPSGWPRLIPALRREAA